MVNQDKEEYFPNFAETISNSDLNASHYLYNRNIVSEQHTTATRSREPSRFFMCSIVCCQRDSSSCLSTCARRNSSAVLSNSSCKHHHHHHHHHHQLIMQLLTRYCCQFKETNNNNNIWLVERHDDRRYRGARVATLRIRGGKIVSF